MEYSRNMHWTRFLQPQWTTSVHESSSVKCKNHFLSPSSHCLPHPPLCFHITSLCLTNLPFCPSDRRHVDWVRSYLSIWTEMQSFIKQHHTTGLEWSKSVSTTHTLLSVHYILLYVVINTITLFFEHYYHYYITPSSYTNKNVNVKLTVHLKT